MLQYNDKTAGISTMEVDYWKKAICSNLKLGIEIETNLDYEEDNSEIMQKLNNELKATNNCYKFGSCGVVGVKYDGSLNNGIELVTVGRRLNFASMYNQYNYIIDKMFKYKTYLDGRCGLHNHMLLSYMHGENSMEIDMPGIILRNFIQLIRRNMPELAYITSTVCDINHENVKAITRYDYYSSWKKLGSTTPLNKSISMYNDALNGDRYRFVNFQHLSAEQDDIKKFHLELRFPDGSLFPAQIAAQGILYTALLIKAVEISEIGDITTGTSEEWEETKRLMSVLRNDNERYDIARCSLEPSEEDLEKIKERTMKFIKNIKPQVDYIDNHVYPILEMLAIKPISLRLHEEVNESTTTTNVVEVYKKVNNDFHKTIQCIYNFKCENYDEIVEAINTLEITEASSREQWIHIFAEKHNKDKKQIVRDINYINNYRKIGFDAINGSLYFK